MRPEDVVVIVVLLIVVAAAGIYVYRAKKSGQKCIGCPASKTCNGSCCSCKDEDKK